tara:strand:+ start:347 stop:1051 length:705 start_codon:yes stop_codon:yes gene_type:complete
MPRKAKKGSSRYYFTDETEDAIVRYNASTDFDERSKIYGEEIHYAYFKLTQNIIHTFKFYYTEVDQIEHLQHEIITYLLSKIHLFDPSRGAKAYSYFGTIVKRWLILYNTKNYKKRVQKVDVVELDRNDDFRYNPGEEVVKSDLDKYMDLYVNHVSEHIYDLFPKGNDAQIADAVLELFRKRENIEIFNKKALYIYIREMVDVKTPKITRIAQQLHTIFKSEYLFYLDNGYARF